MNRILPIPEQAPPVRHHMLADASLLLRDRDRPLLLELKGY